MDLINDLGTDLAFAFLVEKRFRQKIGSKDAARLIGRIRRMLEASTTRAADDDEHEGQIDRLRARHA